MFSFNRLKYGSNKLVKECSFEKNYRTWARKWFKRDLSLILISTNKNVQLILADSFPVCPRSCL